MHRMLYAARLRAPTVQGPVLSLRKVYVYGQRRKIPCF